MTNQNAGPSEEWLVESLRLTVFAASTEVSWEDLVGTGPDEVIEMKRLGQKTEVGLLPDHARMQLTLQTVRDRVDLILSALPNPETVVAHAGSFGEVQKRFDELAKAWLKRNQGPVSRLAVGGVLLSPAADRADGYRRVARFVPTIPLDDVSDFYFQINRRRMSTSAEGLPVNRLAKWSVAAYSQIEIVVGMGQSGSVRAGASEQYALRLELDINTASSAESVLSDPLATYDELVALAHELAERGDVP